MILSYKSLFIVLSYQGWRGVLRNGTKLCNSLRELLCRNTLNERKRKMTHVTKNVPLAACFGRIKHVSKPGSRVSPVGTSAHRWGTSTPGRCCVSMPLSCPCKCSEQNLSVTAIHWGPNVGCLIEIRGSCQLHPVRLGIKISGLKLGFCCGFEQVHRNPDS